MRPRILIVDDTQDQRDRIAEALADDYEVSVAATGEEAVALVREGARFDFALIDQVLAPDRLEGFDGIDTVREMSALYPSTCMVIFSAQAIEPWQKLRALEAGAYDYLERPPAQFQEFLAELSDAIAERADLEAVLDETTRRRSDFLPLTLTNLRVGVTIVDRNFRILWMNEEQKRNIGWHRMQEEGRDYRRSFCYWCNHRRQRGPCPDCLVANLFAGGGVPEPRIVLAPVYPTSDEAPELRYFYVTARPLEGPRTKSLIAVVETASNITDSDLIDQMDWRTQLRLVASAARDAGFRRVRIYQAPDEEQLLPVAQVGGVQHRFEQLRPRMANSPHLQQALSDGPRLCLPQDGPLDTHLRQAGATDGLSWITYPLRDPEGRLVGWLEADRMTLPDPQPRVPLPVDIGHVGGGDVQVLEPYAREAVRILLRAEKTVSPVLGADLRADLRLDAELSLGQPPDKAVALVLQALVTGTGSEMGHVRAMDEDGASLRLIANLGRYGDLAQRLLPRDHRFSWTVCGAVERERLVQSRQPGTPWTAEVQQTLDAMPGQTKHLLDWMHSFLILPVELEGIRLGAVCLQSDRPDTYARPDVLEAVGAILPRMAWALRDYRIAQRGATATTKAWRNIARMTTHKLGNPIYAIAEFLDAQQRFLENNALTEELTREIAASIRTEVERLEQMLKMFERYAQEGSLERTEIELVGLIRRATTQGLGDCDCVTAQICDPGRPIRVYGNALELEEAFVELAMNASHFAREQQLHNYLVDFETVGRPDQIRIIVQDDGPGVPPESKEVIFEPFTHLRLHGRGLGLALISSVLDRHGGDIREVGTYGEGARFVIDLPVLPQQEAD